MNTRSVDTRTTWAVLIMEAALVLPIISLPTQASRFPGLAGPLLLLVLLPAGCAAVYRIPPLRDPSWRLLSGIALALVARAIVDPVPAPGLPGIMTWLARSAVPAAIGIGLWWRGGALAVAELTPADVRTEFSLIAICLLVTLGFARPFLLPDPALLGCSVALFAVGGLIGAALSRQDAADVLASQGRMLAIGTSLLLPAVAVVLVGGLRPELLQGMWLLLAHAIELILTPIGLLIAWLASLVPHGPPMPPPTPVPPPSRVQPDPALLAQAQDRLSWIIPVIIFTLLTATGLAALLVARLLLTNVIGAPNPGMVATDMEEVEAEPSGTPGNEAADLFGWVMRWLRARLRGNAHAGGTSTPQAPADAWTAYQRLLAWADERGAGRRPSETTGQLSVRLSRDSPEAAAAVDLVTDVFERERYGGVHAGGDVLARLRRALGAFAR